MADPSSSNIKPLRIGVRFKPPAVVLFYEGEDKNYHRRTMPVHQFAKNSIVRKAAENLKQRHIMYLQHVQDFKIEKMLRLIQENMKGNSLENSLPLVEKEFSVDPDENLNVLDDDTLKRKKEVMNEMFEKNRKKPNDPDFQYDLQVDFNQDDTAGNPSFDSEDDDDKVC